MSRSITAGGFAALLLTATSPAPASAACSTTLPLVTSAVPSLPGRIVFQGASSSGDTQLYTFDFASKVQTAISASWGLTALRNPAFSRTANGSPSRACRATRGMTTSSPSAPRHR